MSSFRLANNHEKVLRDIAGDQLGYPVQVVERLDPGATNEVLLLHGEKEQLPLVAKLAWQEKEINLKKLFREATVMQILHDIRLQHEVLKHKPLLFHERVDGLPGPLLMMTYINGVPIRNGSFVSVARDAGNLNLLAEFLVRLHAVQFDRFRLFDEQRSCSDFADYLRMEVAQMMGQLQEVNKVDKGQLQRVGEQLERLVKRYENSQEHRMIHRDIQCENLLFGRTTDGVYELRGVVDFETGMTGPIEFEFAAMKVFSALDGYDAWFDQVAALYEQKAGLDPAFRDKVDDMSLYFWFRRLNRVHCHTRRPSEVLRGGPERTAFVERALQAAAVRFEGR